MLFKRFVGCPTAALHIPFPMGFYSGEAVVNFDSIGFGLLLLAALGAVGGVAWAYRPTRVLTSTAFMLTGTVICVGAVWLLISGAFSGNVLGVIAAPVPAALWLLAIRSYRGFLHQEGLVPLVRIEDASPADRFFRH